MSLWSVISGAGSKILTSATEYVKPYASDAAFYVVYHGVSAYMAVTDAINHPLIRDIKNIFLEDVVPIAAAGYLNNLTANYLDEEDNPTATTVKTVVCAALSVYSFGKQVEFAARTVFLTLDAANQLKGRKKDTEYEALCKEVGCTMRRRLQGDWRALFVYFATDLMISETIPYVNPYLIELFRMYLIGHYVLEEITPMCNRHQVQFMRQYPELTLAIGFNHWLMTQLTTQAIQAITWAPGKVGENLLNKYYKNPEDAPFQINTEIPAEYYQDQVKALAVIVEMIIVAHMCLPKPALEPETFDALLAAQNPMVLPKPVVRPANSDGLVLADKPFANTVVKLNRSILADPLMAFQSFAGEEFDLHARWFKSKIEPWIKRASPDAWGKRVDKAVVEAWNHEIWNDPIWQKPFVRYSKKALAKAEQWLLPEMFYKKGALADDFIIGRSLGAWREELLAKIKLIEEIELKIRSTIRVVRRHPLLKEALTTTVVKYYGPRLEIPSEKLILMINVFIKLFSNELLIKRLKQLRVLLEPVTENLPPENNTLLGTRLSITARRAVDDIPITGPSIEEIDQDEPQVASNNAEFTITPTMPIQALPLATATVPSTDTSAPRLDVAAVLEPVSVKVDQEDPAVLLGLRRNSLFRPDSPSDQVKARRPELVVDDLEFLERSNEVCMPSAVKPATVAWVDPLPGFDDSRPVRPVNSLPRARLRRQSSLDGLEFLERSNQVDSPPPVRKKTVETGDSFEPLLGLQISSHS